MMLGDVSEDPCDDGRTTILADVGNSMVKLAVLSGCLLYTSDAADE